MRADAFISELAEDLNQVLATLPGVRSFFPVSLSDPRLPSDPLGTWPRPIRGKRNRDEDPLVDCRPPRFGGHLRLTRGFKHG